MANWHPVTWIYHMVDVEMFGLWPGGPHLVNLLLHGLCSLALFWVLFRMTGNVPRSWVVAALFAVHPPHVESVVRVAERKDVLSTFFWMATMWAYWRYARSPGIGRYFVVVACFALGLLRKPMLVTLLFVLLILDYWPLQRFQPGPGDAGNGRSETWKRLGVGKGPLLGRGGGRGGGFACRRAGHECINIVRCLSRQDGVARVSVHLLSVPCKYSEQFRQLLELQPNNIVAKRNLEAGLSEM